MYQKCRINLNKNKLRPIPSERENRQTAFTLPYSISHAPSLVPTCDQTYLEVFRRMEEYDDEGEI